MAKSLLKHSKDLKELGVELSLKLAVCKASKEVSKFVGKSLISSIARDDSSNILWVESILEIPKNPTSRKA